MKHYIECVENVYVGVNVYVEVNMYGEVNMYVTL